MRSSETSSAQWRSSSTRASGCGWAIVLAGPQRRQRAMAQFRGRSVGQATIPTGGQIRAKVHRIQPAGTAPISAQVSSSHPRSAARRASPCAGRRPVPPPRRRAANQSSRARHPATGQAGRLGHLQAAPLEPARSRLLPGAGLGHQARLADARLAAEQQKLPHAAHQPAGCLLQDGPFGAATDQPHLQPRNARFCAAAARPPPGRRPPSSPGRAGALPTPQRCSCCGCGDRLGDPPGSGLLPPRAAAPPPAPARRQTHQRRRPPSILLAPCDQRRPDLDAGRQRHALTLRRCLQAEGHVQGPFGIIFMAVGHAKKRHDAIRPQVIDIGRVALQGSPRAGEEGVERALAAAGAGCRPASRRWPRSARPPGVSRPRQAGRSQSVLFRPQRRLGAGAAGCSGARSTGAAETSDTAGTPSVAGEARWPALP